MSECKTAVGFIKVAQDIAELPRIEERSNIETVICIGRLPMLLHTYRIMINPWNIVAIPRLAIKNKTEEFPFDYHALVVTCKGTYSNLEHQSCRGADITAVLLGILNKYTDYAGRIAVFGTHTNYLKNLIEANRGPALHLHELLPTN